MATALLMTSNGIGLGHLTRAMAVARRLGDGLTPVIFTLSHAFPVARREGFVTEFLASPNYTQLRLADWHRLLERRVGELLDEYRPAVVTYDGSQVPAGLRAVLAARPAPVTVWFRRGMWKRGDEQLRATSLFDHVLEPGDLAGEHDSGATARDRRGVRMVTPMTFLDEPELLDSPAAADELHLPPASLRVLVQLGAGNAPTTVRSIAEQCAQAVERHPGLQAVVADSPIAPERTALPPALLRRKIYPVSRYLRAFDLAVAASGYNTYHELLRFGVPAIFVPNVDTALDDQVTRAAYAARVGAARMSHPDDIGELTNHLDDLVDPDVRAALRERTLGCRFPNGAEDAARLLEELASERCP